ncbi:unnamed protein product [Lactuca virosa]|uniref:Uncharacterized protein n=1 Tax=Lactuca virosa TaxID=75947 RepID=A0AAU9MV51_9ASTR|nr:unnamed protein product [Lactuca virosa]
METPSSSSRTITRSQALGKSEESEKVVLKSRSAMIDITNDSPIVGLAIGSLKTPSSIFSKKRAFIQNSELIKQPNTPGSGEALLRGQVKTLLQKVEEEAVFSKISFEPRNLIREEEGFVNSPIYLIAPTPANTPQVSEFCENNNGIVSPIVAESNSFSQILGQQEENDETLETNLISKLFTDFPEKLEDCDSSVDNEDDASVWSVQVNVSTSDDELEENHEDELYEVLSKIRVDDVGVRFTGKHQRFVYDGDSELGGEEVV